MLKFCSLYSGSSGNCLFVSSNNTKILIDCGTSCKKICDGLASINSSIDEIDAILVTHEHSDHVQSLGMISKKLIFRYMLIKKHGMQCLNKRKKYQKKIYQKG